MPASSAADASEADEGETVCSWAECSEVFESKQLLGEHLNDVHIGKKQSSYICEWIGCLRNGEPLPNRFALVAHLRRHTGERAISVPTLFENIFSVRCSW